MFEQEVDERFKDRRDAAGQLAKKLAGYRGVKPVFLALSLGGVEIGFYAAREIGGLLDLYGIRPVPAPDDESYFIGAITQTGLLVLDDHSIGYKRLRPSEVRRMIAQERDALARDLAVFGNEGRNPSVETRVVILVDEGISTAMTVRAALAGLWLERPAKMLLAVPVCPMDIRDAVEPDVDEFICLRDPVSFAGVEEWYERFPPVSQAQAVALLAKAREEYPHIPDVP